VKDNFQIVLHRVEIDVVQVHLARANTFKATHLESHIALFLGNNENDCLTRSQAGNNRDPDSSGDSCDGNPLHDGEISGRPIARIPVVGDFAAGSGDAEEICGMFEEISIGKRPCSGIVPLSFADLGNTLSRLIDGNRIANIGGAHDATWPAKEISNREGRF
jgi:hypothetical protein